MLKIITIILSYLFAVSVIISTCNTLRSRHHKSESTKETKCCIGCKHLDYYNDGSPFCIKNIDHACIMSGFSFREEEN